MNKTLATFALAMSLCGVTNAIAQVAAAADSLAGLTNSGNLALPTLTTVRQVNELSPEAAARGYPVRLQGVLTFHDWDLSFFQDDTGAIYLNNLDRSLHAGAEVVVEGFTSAGQSGSMVIGRDGAKAAIRAVGPIQWPQPKKVSAASLDEDRYGGQWVSVSGKVTKVASAHDGIILDLLSDGVLVQAAIPRWPQNWVLPGYLRDLPVTVRGAVSRRQSQMDGMVQNVGTVLCTPSLEMVEVSPEALDDLFKLPRENYLKLFRFTTWENPAVRIYGQVLFIRPGLGFFVLMEDKAIIWVQTSLPGTLMPGGFVDVVGRLDTFDGRALLTDAYFRAGKPGTLPPPWKQTAREVNEFSHGGTIRVEGRLVGQQASVSEDSLVLENQGVTFLARLFHVGNVQLPKLQPGTLLQLSGLCVIKRMPLPENLPQTFAFQLWLPSPADVQILQRPPWWTVERVFILCGVILLLGLLAVGWAALLRRQVARQSTLIASQREQHAVAEERSRIAREFHDTVQQQLAGINLELETTELNLEQSPAEARKSVGLTRQMIRHSLAETRQTIWDLRSPALERGGLVVALQNLVSSLQQSSSMQLGLQVAGAPRRLSGTLEHGLFRIAQEAMTNAIKHSKARHCNLTIDFAARSVRLRVQDDGCGFQGGSFSGDGEMHFGLLGMRERANKLEGAFDLHSQPGQGTKIEVTVEIA